MKKRTYILYDARFRTDPDSAIVLEVCDTLEQARNSLGDYGGDEIIVSYNVKKDGELVDERME